MVSRKDFERLGKDIREMYPMLAYLETRFVLKVAVRFGDPLKLHFFGGYTGLDSASLDANQLRTLGFELVELGDRLASLTLDAGEGL